MKIKQACNDVDINDCICSACRLKYLKKLKSSTYTPEKTRKIDRNPCFLTNFFKCSDLSERDNQCQIESFNSACSLQCVLIPTTCTIPLCMRHRRDLSRYEEAQGLSKCSVCEGLLKLDSKKYSSSVLSEGDVKDVCFIKTCRFLSYGVASRSTDTSPMCSATIPSVPRGRLVHAQSFDWLSGSDA